MVAPRASASCELWVGGQQVACTRDELFDGDPTVLDDLSIPWGRSSLWSQPDPGTVSFRIRDQRTAPQPLEDIIHAGAKIDVWAGVPIDSPAPETVMDQDFQSVATAGGVLDSALWERHTFPAELLRRNRATDPNCTATTGKTAGGSATIALNTTWSQFGTSSISVTPNGSNNASSVFPQGATGMTVFEAGKTYTVSCYYRQVGAQSGTLNADARKITVRGGPVSAVKFAESAQAPNATGVTRLSVTFTVPANYTLCTFQIVNGSANAIDIAWYDGLLIEEGSTLRTYFDGATTQSGYSYAWTGTANASASTESYLASSGSETVIIFNSSISPPGEGTQSAHLQTSSRRVAYEFPPYRFLSDWPRHIDRYMLPGETWTYSIMIRLPAAGRIDLSFLARTNSDPDQPTADAIISIDGAGVRQITGTGAWVTYTGTLTNTAAVPVWPTVYLLCYPSAYSAAQVNSAIDAVELVAPAQSEKRILVWAGRVSDVEIEPAERAAVMINATGVAAAAEVANYTVGDEPWPAELITERMRRIFDAVPFPINRDFTMSLDKLLGLSPAVGSVRPRDVDKQPILDLLRDYADDAFAVVWPVNHPVARNHLWVENVALRGTSWAGTTVHMSACDLSKSRFRMKQTTADMLTVADVKWLVQVTDPVTSEVTYEPVTETVTDDDAVETYGAMLISVETELSSATAANNLGTAMLDWSRASAWSIEGVSFDTKRVDNTDGEAQTLLEMLLDSARRPGTHVEIDDLPEYVPVDVASGFIEGGTIAYRSGRWQFELNVSSGNPNGGS